MKAVAMFPLGTVLFPGVHLPLRIFEQRYLQLFSDISETNQDFGTCLIEKGHEVGGNDSRFSYGTLCKVVDSEELALGQLGIQSIGIKRVIIKKWLPDNPYPMANLEILDDSEDTDFPYKQKIIEELERCYVLLVQMGAVQPESMNIKILDQLDLFSACSLAPLGQLDKYNLLKLDTSEDRSNSLLSLITSERETLAAMSRLQQEESK
jgi:Lon protease-like protein